MKRILLSLGEFAIVDDADYDLVKGYKWYAAKRPHTCYAIRYYEKDGRRTSQLMHRLIMPPPDGFEIDHINGNGRDNRRTNLRVCTHSQNAHNSHAHKDGISRFKGVSWVTRLSRWQVYIQYEKIQYYLGLFDDEIKAAKAYDVKARELFREYARTNF